MHVVVYYSLGGHHSENPMEMEQARFVTVTMKDRKQKTCFWMFR